MTTKNIEAQIKRNLAKRSGKRTSSTHDLYQIKVALATETGRAIGFVSYAIKGRSESHAIVKAGIRSAKAFPKHLRELAECVRVDHKAKA